MNAGTAISKNPFTKYEQQGSLENPVTGFKDACWAMDCDNPYTGIYVTKGGRHYGFCGGHDVGNNPGLTLVAKRYEGEEEWA